LLSFKLTLRAVDLLATSHFELLCDVSRDPSRTWHLLYYSIMSNYSSDYFSWSKLDQLDPDINRAEQLFMNNHRLD
jgi:hypothetical protein